MAEKTSDISNKMKCLRALFLIGLLHGSFAFDYDATPMEDPLQPIWSRLESLSTDILQGFQDKMEGFLQQTKDNIETKFQALQADLNSRVVGNEDAMDADTLVNEVHNAVATWMQTYYQRTIKVENEAAILKAEGNIRVRIDALENKLIEHINVKFDSLTSATATDGNSSRGTAIAPTSNQVRELESRIISHLTTKMNDMENSVDDQLTRLASSLTDSSATLTNINSHVIKITEELADAITAAAAGSGNRDTTTRTSSSGESSQSCTALVTKVSELMNGPQLTTDFLEQQETRWKEMQSVIAEVRETPSYLPRDCSDIHWLHHDASSGVYQIYPTLDRKDYVNVWCDMAEGRDKSDGGWTVILRRRKTDFGLVDFNRTWKEYATGFGDPAEGEWWFSLSALHALTYRQPYNIQFQITDIEDGPFVADYTTFRVEDEAHKFRLIVDGFRGNVSIDAFKSKHHGRPFSTPDEDNDNWPPGSCAFNNHGGWWYDACHYVTLTGLFPNSTDRDVKTIKWRNNDKWLVLNDVTMKIRPDGYGQRFDVHSYNGEK